MGIRRPVVGQIIHFAAGSDSLVEKISAKSDKLGLKNTPD
jgi:hypothetical protein